MHTFNESANGVPAFLAKLWRLVEDPDTNNLIYWQSDGRSFIIQNQAQFARELLPLYYKHNNMASFIRQLNMYGFHKIASIDNGGLKFDKDEMEFSHAYFQRDSPYLLEHIKRKIATTKQVPEDKAAIKPEIVNKVMSEVRTVRGRQDTLDSRFSAMKQENEALWREIAVLRQKHMKQQQIVNKLIQFLVTLVQPPARGGAGINAMNGVKRRFQLMINDVPNSAKQRKQSQDSGDSGPVIHELTEDLLDDCNYDYDAPIDSPTILSPNALSATDGDVDEVSSPTNFKIEKMTDLVDDLNTEDADIDINDDEVSYIVDKQPKNYQWIKSNTATENAANQMKTAEPVQEYVISFIKPGAKSKTKMETKVATKPVVASKSQLPGTSLLNQQQVAKKRPQLMLKMNKPIRNDGKTIQPAVGPGKVVVAKKPTTATVTTTKPSNQSESVRQIPSKSYTSQSDFNDSDMPHDLFESSDDTVSPLLKSDINVASGSYNATLSDDHPKKVLPTSSKNLAIAKYNNKQDSEDIQLNTPEDVNKQIETIQGDLDSLTKLLQADTDYSLDANSLFGNLSGSSSSSTKNRLLLSPSVDSELFSKIFGDLDAPFGLSLNPDFPMDKRDDAGASGSELMNYQPYNSLDLSEILDSDAQLGIEDKQNENGDEDSLLNAPELNTPRIDRKTISFNTKQ